MPENLKERTLLLGLSSSLTGAAAYSFIVSMYHFFTPGLGIVAGLIGGMGIAARDLLSEKEKFDDIPLKDLATYIMFGIIALFLGYIFVYYFAMLPDLHGELIKPAEHGTIYDFFSQTMGRYDILGAVFGSICSSSIPFLFKDKINNFMKKPDINR